MISSNLIDNSTGIQTRVRTQPRLNPLRTRPEPRSDLYPKSEPNPSLSEI